VRPGCAGRCSCSGVAQGRVRRRGCAGAHARVGGDRQAAARAVCSIRAPHRACAVELACARALSASAARLHVCLFVCSPRRSHGSSSLGYSRGTRTPCNGLGSQLGQWSEELPVRANLEAALGLALPSRTTAAPEDYSAGTRARARARCARAARVCRARPDHARGTARYRAGACAERRSHRAGALGGMHHAWTTCVVSCVPLA
jgi:hypothetical protein